MQTPQTIYGLNAFVALERRGVRQYVDSLSRERPTQWSGRLRNQVVQHSFRLVRQAHDTFGTTLSQGLGTGPLPAHAGHLLGHVPNPGMNPQLDSVQAALQGGLFSPIVAVVCLPWLPLVGLGVGTAALGLSVGGAASALVLQRTRAQGHSVPWLESAAGLLTALGRASLTVYAALLGATWGVLSFAAAAARPASGPSRS